MAVRSLFLLLALTATLVIAADKEIESGSVGAKIMGSSGKIQFAPKGSDGKIDYSDGFTLEVDSVMQFAADGTTDVGKKVNSLASQEFNFSPLNQNAKYQGIDAVNIDLNAYLADPEATLKLEVYIFKEAGNLTFGNENFQVGNGTLKLLIKLENYTFCEGSASGPCKKNEVGKYVDVAIVVKSKGDKKATKRADGDKEKIKCAKKDECPDVYGFGDEAEMALTKSMIADDMTKTSPSGYPKADTQGSKQRFIFRAAKFNASVVFDPTISITDPEDSPSSVASSLQFSFALLIAMLIALFM